MTRKGDEINKAVLGGAAVRRVPMGAPAKPFVAQVAQAGTKGLYEENQRLKAERADGRVILALDPKRIRFSHIADRDERSLTLDDPDFATLVTDLRENEQEYPIKVKTISGDPEHDYELVAGHRRLRACQLLDAEIPGGRTVLSILDGKASELRSHALKMWKENSLRKDPSAWEQGKRFRLWIEEGIYGSQAEIAEATKLAKGSISNYIALAELPDAVIHAFGDPRVISYRWIRDLVRVWKENPDWVTKNAKRIGEIQPRPDPMEILKALTRKAPAGRPKGSTKAESVKEGNKVLFTLSAKDDRVAIKLGKQVDSGLRKDLQTDIKEFVHAWLAERMGK